MDSSEAERVRRREEALQRTLDLLGDSVSVLAHEIKNPRTAISLALRAVADKLGEDEEAVLQDLVARLDRLELRLRRVLALSAPLDIAPGSCEAGKLLRGAANGAPVEAAPDCPRVLGNTELLTEALAALVDNAARAGRVALRVRGDGAGLVRIEVDDDGPGVPDAQKEIAFQPFFTTDDQRSGLGLAIAKRIVEAHGGTIGLEEAPGGGTRAWIELPAAGA